MSTTGFTTLDICLGVIILIFCILGFIKGAVRQFFGILALVVASAASVVVPYMVKIPEIEGLSSVWKHVIFSVLVWVPSFLILNTIGKFFTKRMAKKEPAFTDRLWGALFGVVKGLVVLVVVIFIIDIIPLKTDSVLMSQSKVVSAIKPYNPLLKFQIMQNLQDIIAADNDVDYAALLGKDPEFLKLKQAQAIKSILSDPELVRILENKEYTKFITNPKVQELAKDKEALKMLLSTDIDKTVIKNI